VAGQIQAVVSRFRHKNYLTCFLHFYLGPISEYVRFFTVLDSKGWIKIYNFIKCTDLHINSWFSTKLRAKCPLPPPQIMSLGHGSGNVITYELNVLLNLSCEYWKQNAKTDDINCASSVTLHVWNVCVLFTCIFLSYWSLEDLKILKI
jgi:hypothetical protein